MKNIVFRAYDKKEKKWLMGYDVGSLGGFSLFGECMLLGEWSHVLEDFLFERDGHKQDDLVVMQYTGLQDKNGKSIYEGDVLRDAFAGSDNPSILTVDWQTKFACFIWRHIENDEPWFPNQQLDGGHVEIIGNIYENPDLIAPQE